MTSYVLQIGTLDLVREAVIQIIGLGLGATVLAAVGSVLYRWRTTRPLPIGTGAFLGIVAVSVPLLAEVVLSGTLVASVPYGHRGSAIYAVAGLSLGSVAGAGGRHLGDRIACSIADIERLTGARDVRALLRSARVLTVVTMPADVSDARGYNPVNDETKRALAETTFRFPDRLSKDQLVERLERRIVTDYDVDHAAVTLDERWDVSLSVGADRSGLGSTLPPGTVATEIRADPAGDASPGDPVEIWTVDAETTRLLARGRLRSGRANRATVIVDRDEVSEFDSGMQYRLVTPAEIPSDQYRLTSLLRSVEETTIAVSVTEDDSLAGEFVGWLPGVTLVIERDGDVLPLPQDRTTIQEDDTIFLVGRPSTFEDHSGLREKESVEV